MSEFTEGYAKCNEHNKKQIKQLNADIDQLISFVELLRERYAETACIDCDGKTTGCSHCPLVKGRDIEEWVEKEVGCLI